MATAPVAFGPVGIAPVLTPRTISALASELVDFPEVASSLRGLGPFVDGVVERFFVPLLSSGMKDRFPARFARLSREFEPFRLYVNIRVLSSFKNKDFGTAYRRILREMLGPLLSTARQMEMAPELISALVGDYLMLVERLANAATSAPSLPSELTVEQFSGLVRWMHEATRFDYGLTAVFLVLEGAISMPSPTIKTELLIACKKSLLQFARSTIDMLGGKGGPRTLDMLRSNKLEIEGLGRRFRVVPKIQRLHGPGGSLASHSRRQAEFEWLKKNIGLTKEHEGKWIVLEKDDLVASDVDYQKARAIATTKGIKRPFIIYVPRAEDGGFMGI